MRDWRENWLADKYSFLLIKYPKADIAGHGGPGHLNKLAFEDVVKVRDAVVLTKTEEGKLKVHQTKDDSWARASLRAG